jgi:hypothetical protein
MTKKVIVNDNMQSAYVYYLEAPAGKNFDSEFKPELTPEQMLESDCSAQGSHQKEL